MHCHTQIHTDCSVKVIDSTASLACLARLRCASAKRPLVNARFGIFLQLSTRFATELVGQLAHAEALKTAIRDAGGLLALVRHLKVGRSSLR